MADRAPPRIHRNPDAGTASAVDIRHLRSRGDIPAHCREHKDEKRTMAQRSRLTCYTQSMQTLIKDVMAVEDGRIVRTDLWIDGDTIAAADTRTPDRVIDGTGLTAVPGFIDTHIHGFGGKGTEDGTAEAILTMSDELASEGVTAFFPTIYTDTMERMLNDERAIVEAKGRESGAAIGGIHVEGPFISPGKIGAQNPLGRQDPSLDTFHKILSEGKGLVKAMTCAPELPGIGEIARAAEKEGVVLLMGHTDATYDEAMREQNSILQRALRKLKGRIDFSFLTPSIFEECV